MTIHPQATTMLRWLSSGSDIDEEQLLESHRMREAQVIMQLEGSLEQPQGFVSARAGEAHYRVQRSGDRQLGRAHTVRDELKDWAINLERDALTKLSGLADLDATLSMQGLVRERHIHGISAASSEFAAFWGKLWVPGHWTAVFGSNRDGDLTFRRGPWEEWPIDLPQPKNLPQNLPMILSPYCATLFHEAVGHTLEEEYLEASPLKYYRGEALSHKELTIMDRPDLEGYAGSMLRDDTGQPASATTLIQSGILVGDLAANKGAWRRSSYRALPLVRATNFLIRAGEADPKGWLTDLPECLYICAIRRGQWQPGSPQFKVLTGLVFHLKGGQPIAYREWINLEFDTRQFLASIKAVGNDLCMDPVVHWCQKQDQSVPMSMGGPSLLLGAQP